MKIKKFRITPSWMPFFIRWFLAHPTVYVTQEDIDKGTRGSNSFCPVARALKRHGYPDPVVRLSIVNYGDRKGTGFFLPRQAEKFIEEFDRLGPAGLQPFSFRAQKDCIRSSK